jgi:hypothetical protein
MARPERFELPTAWFVARYSIQLSYGRIRLPIIPKGLCQFKMSSGRPVVVSASDETRGPLE